MNDWLGGTIGNYRIEESLGVGGMGRVYRAVHIHIHRVAAIKVLHEQIAIDPAFQARFLREAQAVAALHHPNIVDILDFNEDKGVFYLVMEYVPDGSLRALLKQQAEQRRTLPLAVGLDLIRQAAEALDYAHRSGMVHRDIKPDNLLLKRDPSIGKDIVKVADFGLARLGDSTALTIEGQAMGTPAYMSPEQCQGIDLDGRSDIYSLGVVLFEVATGAVPFVMKSLTDAIYKHVYVAPPSPRDVRPNLPDELSAIILRCLEKNPDDRFATAGELAAELNRLIRAGVQDVPLATTLVELPLSEQLRVVLDTGEVPLTPGEVSALTVTLVNLGSSPVQASISIDGVPDDWIATPSRDVQIAPGAEVSGPLRVQIPAGAGISPGEYPVVVRAAARENPEIRAEATTRILVRAVGSAPPVVVAPGANGGQPPVDGGVVQQPGMPAWWPAIALVLLLLVIGGIAYALLGNDDPGDDDDDLIAAGATETARASATGSTTSNPTATVAGSVSTSSATATTVVVVDPGETPTEAAVGTETPTEAVAVSDTPTAVVAVVTETATPFVPIEAILFSTGRNLDDPAGTLDIYQMNPDGSDQRPLISEPDDDWLAAFSPDGTRVVWVSRRHGNHQIYIAMADGSGVRRLTTSGGDDLYPLWSPDGVHILFSRNEDGDDELYKLNVDDGTLLRMTDNDAYDGLATWSPDGTRIAWTTGIDGNNEIYSVDATDDSAEPQRLTNDPASDVTPIWSPSSNQLIFISNREGDNDIYHMQADGSEVFAVTTDAADEIAPAWSPDGSLIAYCRKTATGCDIYSVVIGPSPTETLVVSGASMNDPDITWSPDSSQLTYLSESDGNYDIWAVALDGSPPRRLTDAPGNDANVSWFAPAS